MRVRLSVFYPLSDGQRKEAAAHLTKKLQREEISVVVDLRMDSIETKAIVCSFEEPSAAFVMSSLVRELFQKRVQTEVARWAGPQVRVLVSGMQNHRVSRKRLAAA